MIRRLGDWIAYVLVPYFMGSNRATHWGHAVQAFVITFLLCFVDYWGAFAFNTGAWWHREVSDFVSPVARGELSWLGAWLTVTNDGVADFLAPFFVGGMALPLHALIFEVLL